MLQFRAVFMRYLYLLGFLASFLMVACSDPVKADPDSSSSSSSSSSSIAEITSSSSDDSVEGKSSSSIANTPNPRSSSSSIINNPSQAKSSSSGTSATSSSSTNSSSSSMALSSSSSDGLNSSSSSGAKSSSSVASSSSRAKSSSSFKTQDDIPFGGINIIYDSIVDPRDGHKYLYSTYTGWDGTDFRTYTIMVQNLNYAEKITLGAEEQDDDTKVEKYCYDDIPQNCDFYGGLYQWAEMMALPYECNTISCAHLIQEQHQGICPDGWHLMTNPEIRSVINSTDEGIEGVKARSTWAIGGGRNTSGFTLLGAGGRNTNKTFIFLNEAAFWFFPTEDSERDNVAYQGYISGNEGVFGIDKVYSLKDFGSSARCVMDY